MRELAWINGKTTELSKACISLEDRGFFFGDGVYEVVRIYNGKPFCLEPHLQRLHRSAAAIMLDLPCSGEELEAIVLQLIEDSGSKEAYLYMQLTRGVAPRNHLFPEGARPTLVMYVRGFTSGFGAVAATGASCITVADERWLHCDIKAISLLPNVLAKEKARKEGAYESIFYRPGGVVTEGASTNVFAVMGGCVYTHPESNLILSGITRQVILELLAAEKAAYREEALTLEQLRRAEEIWLSSTTAEIVPVISLDGQAVGDGKPGQVTRRIAQAYREAVQRHCG